ncbi:hypothetical protein G5714_004050 [Onychostoma macrolepis]|uniref:Uncharacterized protein n=1 Tax=Onychostoma macrolepis TaxID=369639 RepID=A0A7J6DBP4_9TELE|nr:hypothetical protein G5714_004050 [Onychostoma macrolepis]
MDIINVSCVEIQSPAGFLYVILSVLLNQTNNPDCEQSWYSQDGLMIADPSEPQTLIDPVISVSSDRLVTSRCVNLSHEIICDSSGFRLDTIFRGERNSETHQCVLIEIKLCVELNLQVNHDDCECVFQRGIKLQRLQTQKLIAPVISVSSDRLVTSHCVNELHHEIICHSDGLKHETMFRAFNDSVSGSTQSPESHQWWWISVLIFIVLLVFICFLLRERIFRCFPSVFQCNDSENRDPGSGVQMQLRSDESDSLN